MSDIPKHQPQGDDKAKFHWILIGFFVIAAFYFFSEHRAHALGILPYVLLLACPLMHIFMHHGQDKDKEHRHD